MSFKVSSVVSGLLTPAQVAVAKSLTGTALLAGFLSFSNSASAACVDTVPLGNGWGWDGTASCRVGADSRSGESCVDTAPVGDGWGWNGSSSCRVTASGGSGDNCIDTAPIGDGWGWDGNRSCQISSGSSGNGSSGNNESVCLDTDPVGDGWGWNGSSSCRVAGSNDGVVVVEENTNKKIMAVGDSITHGSRGQRGYRFYFLPLMDQAGCEYTMVGSQSTNDTSTGFISPHESYSTMKADHFLTGHTTWSGTNEGIRTTMNRYQPDVVMLHIGSNDIYFEESTASIVEDIRQMVSIMTSTNPQATILLSNIIPWYGSSPTVQNYVPASEALGEGIRSYVRNLGNPSVRFVDVFSGFTRDMMISDMVHPNDDGERRIADKFFTAYTDMGLCR